MAFKIGCVGAGGVGKSGVALELAGKLGIPYIAAKGITRPILERLEYKYTSGTYVEEFLANSECQKEILSLTIEAEKQAGDYVTDRTSIDLAAYAIVLLHRKIDFVDEIFAACSLHASTYTHLFLCPWEQTQLVPNGVRTLSPWFQFMVHSTIIGLLREWDIPYSILPAGKDRVETALKTIQSA
jgi:hypothetical protein